MPRTEFENYLFELLSADEMPKPKFQFFLKTGKGTVVGMCWYSVEYGYGASLHPGWWYVVQSGCNHLEVCEESLQLIAED